MLEMLLGTLFGNSCLTCGLPARGGRFCAACISLFPVVDCFCERCGQPLETRPPPGVNCADCQKKLPNFSKARARFHYAFPIDSALKKMKFHRQLAYAPAFAELLLPVMQACFSECDAIIPVPLHRWRHVTRGFNQARELAAPLARLADLPMVDTVIRTRATPPQSGLTRTARRKNLQGAFEVCGEWRGRRPLIIDDVMTTGTTCNQLAKLLLRAGADRVDVLTVARASQL
jgi:ComF family protein